MNITRIKYFLLGRRGRERRPFGVVFYSLLILMLPLYYYMAAADYSWRGFYQWEQTLRLIPYPHYIISVCAVVCAAALFLVLKNGFFLFCILSLIFIFYNLVVFFTSADIFDVESVALSFVTISAFIYFTSRENSAPYTYNRHRGWRREIRRRVPHTVIINKEKFTVVNINSRGMLVKSKQCSFTLGEEMECTLNVSGERFHIDAVVVRTENDVFACAFRNMDRKTRKDLYYALKHLEEEKAPGGQS